MPVAITSNVNKPLKVKHTNKTSERTLKVHLLRMLNGYAIKYANVTINVRDSSRCVRRAPAGGFGPTLAETVEMDGNVSTFLFALDVNWTCDSVRHFYRDMSS